MSDKERLLDLLRKNANSKGRVYLSPLKIRRTVGTSAHDLTKDLFQMQVEGKVDLTTKRSGQHVRIMSIRVRPAAMVQDTVPEPTERSSPALSNGAGIQAPEATETPTEAVPVVRSLSGYPEIEDLFIRRDQLKVAEQAAEMLELIGQDELAAQAMVAVASLTPLEKEIVQYVEEHNEG